MNQISKEINSTLTQVDNLPNSLHLRPKVCAQLMGVSIATFWRLVKSGEIKTHKLTERTTSVKLAELRAFIESKGV